MRKTMAIGVIGSAVFAAVVLLAQSNEPITPLNMKTGLWQTTMTVKYVGLPSQYAAAMDQVHTYSNCLKPEDLTRDAWAKDVVGKCSSVTVLDSTGTDTDVSAKDCDAGEGMTAEGRGKFHLVDSGHLTGAMDVTFSSNSPLAGNGSVHMNADYDSKWIGATCPADLE